MATEDANKKKRYPSFRIERAINGWIIREYSSDYDDELNHIAGDFQALESTLAARVTALETKLEAGEIVLS